MNGKGFADKYDIRMSLRDEGIRTKKDGDCSWEHRAFVATLKQNDWRRRMQTPWSQGVGVQGKPQVGDVLESLAIDCRAASDAQSFEDFADDFGFDHDSLSAYRMWEACKTQYAKAEGFFGDAFAEFLEVAEEG